IQRFNRVDMGTVQMTTNLAVDLRDLFVMPRLLVRENVKGDGKQDTPSEYSPMDLAAARRYFEQRSTLNQASGDGNESGKRGVIPALEQITHSRRNVIIGVPGSGKSTFLEWLQLKVAWAEQELVLAGKQAIPLLLRVRQLDPLKLPTGAAMIERATASHDRA